jgi:hypothetical protein
LPPKWLCRNLKSVDAPFTPHLEAKLAKGDSQQGCDPDELIQESVERHLGEESRFIQAVNRGEKSLQRGKYLTHEQVGQRLERFLRS